MKKNHKNCKFFNKIIQIFLKSTNQAICYSNIKEYKHNFNNFTYFTKNRQKSSKIVKNEKNQKILFFNFFDYHLFLISMIFVKKW